MKLATILLLLPFVALSKDTTFINKVSFRIGPATFFDSVFRNTVPLPAPDTITIVRVDTVVQKDTVIVGGINQTNGLVIGGPLRYAGEPVYDNLSLTTVDKVAKMIAGGAPPPKPANINFDQVFYSQAYTKPVWEYESADIPVGGVVEVDIFGYVYNYSGGPRDMQIRLMCGGRDIAQPASVGNFQNNGRFNPVKITLKIYRPDAEKLYAFCTLWIGAQMFTTNSFATQMTDAQFGTLDHVTANGRITFTISGFTGTPTKYYFRRDIIQHK